MDYENSFDENQEDVVDLQDEEMDNENDIEIEGEKDQDVAEPAQDNQSQSKEENAQFKKMRLKAEKEAQEKYEKELASIEKEKQALEKEKQKIKLNNIEQEIINEYLSAEKIQQYMYDNDVDQNIAIKLLKSEAIAQAAAKKEQYYESLANIEKQKQEFKKDPYFNYINKDVENMVINNPSLDYGTAYYYYLGQNIDKINNDMSKNKEKSVVANMQDRMKRKSISSDNGGNGPSDTRILDDAALEMTRAFGNSPEKIAKYVQDNYKKKKG